MTWQRDDARLEHARTVTFCVAAFAQLLFAVGCRSDRLTAVQLGFYGNPALLLAVAVSALLQAVVVTLPPTQSVFEVASGGPGRDWPLVLGLAIVPLAVVEASKIILQGLRRWAKSGYGTVRVGSPTAG
jgi:Ca2+-transporting ATPase